MAKTPPRNPPRRPKAAGGKKKKTRVESYSTYIYRVLKQVHPDTGISKKGAHPRPDDATRAPDAHPRRARAPDTRTRAARPRHVRTFTDRGPPHAPGELSKHAVSEGTKAVTKFSSS
ncbi:hypothetical protein JL720_12899 [Aureococcus anophagefferens]|nr:hypothetical protein JL720_12899 [Aureococcus anophagefferens]